MAGRDQRIQAIPTGQVQVGRSDTALADDPRGPAPGTRRTRTFAAARRHSRVVSTLKVAIPIGALVAVALVVAVSLFNPFGRIPGLTLGPISFSGNKIAMERPRLTGFRKDNRPYEVVATAASQDIRKPNVIELKDMRAKLATDDAGGIAQLTSNSGIFDTGKEHLDLSDNIRIWTSKGEEIFLQTASIDLKAGSAVSRDPVKVRTPTLTLDADGMEMADSGKTLVFTGRVRTRLIPSTDGGRKPAVAGSAPGVAGSAPGVAGTAPGGGKILQAEAGERP